MKTAANHFMQRPHTKLGWSALALAVASVVLLFSWSFLPWGAWPSFLCGFIGGVIGLIAVARQQERSWLVFLSILPLLNVLIFIAGEFLFPH